MIARLGVLLGLDTAEFNKGLADAGKKLDEFVAHAQRGAAIAATAFVGMTVKAMQYADEIADVAKANDIAIDSVIKLQNALANSGGSAENAGKLLSSFSSYVDKAAEGSFEAQKLFSKLGVSFQDLGKLSTEELFNKTVKGIAAIEDPLTRAAKGMEVFGKAAKGVDFVGMAEGIESATQATEQQADAIKVMADLYDSIAQAARDFQLTFIEAVAPSIKATIDYIKELKDGGLDFGGAIRIALETILVLGANVAYVFREIAEGIKLTFQQAWALATLDFKEFGRAFDESQEKTRKNLEALQNFERRVMRDAGGGRGFINPELVRGGDSPGRATTVGRDKDAEKAEKERLKELQERMRINARLHALQLQEIDFVGKEELAYGRLVGRMVDYQNAQERRIDVDQRLLDLEARRLTMFDYEYQFEAKRIQLMHEHAEAQREIEHAGLLPEERARRLARENELYEKRLSILRQTRDIEAKKREGDLEEGFMRGFGKFIKELPTELERGAMVFDSLMGNMTNALERFVRTGKSSFKDLAKSIIQDLLLIQLRAQMSGIFRMLGMAMGISGPNPIGMSGYSDMSTFTALLNAGGLADGGTARAGDMHLVGERGPELFVPRVTGTVIPNEKIGRFGGGTTVNNYNIQAIDVKSFEQRLMGSSRAIWAANQYAQKGLAVTPGRM
jgi:lambda family phage tail tape measure protein